MFLPGGSTIFGDQDCARKCHTYSARTQGDLGNCQFWGGDTGKIFGANYNYRTKQCQCACKGGKKVNQNDWSFCEFQGNFKLFVTNGFFRK